MRLEAFRRQWIINSALQFTNKCLKLTMGGNNSNKTAQCDFTTQCLSCKRTWPPNARAWMGRRLQRKRVCGREKRVSNSLIISWCRTCSLLLRRMQASRKSSSKRTRSTRATELSATASSSAKWTSWRACRTGSRCPRRAPPPSTSSESASEQKSKTSTQRLSTMPSSAKWRTAGPAWTKPSANFTSSKPNLVSPRHK